MGEVDQEAKRRGGDLEVGTKKMPGEGLDLEVAIDQEADPEVVAEKIAEGDLEVKIDRTDQGVEKEGRGLVVEINLSSLHGQESHSPEHLPTAIGKGEGVGNHQGERKRSKRKKGKKQPKEKNKISKIVMILAPIQTRMRKIHQ